MKTLNHPISLWVKAGSHDPQNSEDRANLRPNKGRELRTSIRGQESWDSKPQNTCRDESSNTSLRSDGGEKNSLQPPGGSVYHCQEKAKQEGRFNMRLDLTLLTSETGPCPEANIFGKAGPHKSRGQKPPRSLCTGMGVAMKNKEQLMM